MANEFIARNGITSLGNIVVSGSITTTGTVVISGSIASASFAATASSADNFLTRGTLTAQTLVVQTITSSVDFVTGSTQFGSLLSNTHVFSGSVTMNPGGLFVSSSGIVGIGTTTPTSLLEVQANQNTQTGIRVRNSTSGTGATVEFGAYTNSGNAGFGKYSTGTNAYKNISAGSTFVYNGASGDIALLNDFASGSISFAAGGSSTAQMFITSGGSVGIGTTSPSTVFHVNGSSSRVAVITTSGALSSGYYDAFQILAANQTGGGLSLNIGKAESTNDLAKMVYFHSSNGSTSNRLGFGFYANDGLFNILASGNVGIGNTSPQGALHIGGALASSGDAAAINLKQTGTNETTGIYLERSGERKGYAIYVGGSLDSLVFQRNNAGTKSDVLTLTRDGNIGIRTSNPRTILQVTPVSNAEAPVLGTATGVATFTSANTNYGLQFNSTSDGSFHVQSQRFDGAAVAYSLVLQPAGSNVYMGTASNQLANATTLLGILAGTGTDAINIKHTQDGNNTINIWQTGGGSSHSALAFYKGDTQSIRGSVSVSVSGTTYNTSSDYRLKTNIRTLENGLDRLMQLKPSKFNWIETGEETEGFIAHEVQEIFPYAVTGEKDAVYSSTGNIKPQSVDYGRITPLLAKAIQELKAENDSLKLRIEALENK